ncbi:MAG: EamA family transporter RarD [Planctomycetaceae bacterium]|nr:EamA family transporter RarD [Planctomycetaceae bacterium]
MTNLQSTILEVEVSDPAAAKFRSGLVFGLIAYSWWGLVPLYFSALQAFGMPAWEILAHRITWSLPIMIAITAVVGGWSDLYRVLRNRKLVLTLLLSSVLLAVNWLLYIYATVTNRVPEASLGYYMMPLVNAALATVFLGEKLRPAHYPALALVAIGVAIPCIVGGYFPWLALSLTVSFGCYGVVRKQVAVESITGLTVETLLLLPISLGFLGYLWSINENHMGQELGLSALIAFSGIVTVVPLITFTLSIRRLPLLAVSFIQFLSPTIQLILSVVVLNHAVEEGFPAAFACVFAAVLIFVGDALWQVRARKRQVRLYSTVGPKIAAVTR